jgi:putative nucleotidyltransferase with HDIG domain
MEYEGVRVPKTVSSPKDLIPVDIRSFRNLTRDITFDVYLKLSDDNVAHIFSKTTGLDYKRLAQYIQKGVENLYILPDDEAAYREFIAKPASAIFMDPNTSQEKKIATLLNMTEQNMAEIFSQIQVPEETVEASQKVIRSYVDLMSSAPHTLALILKLVSHGDYLYYHSIAVAIFSMFIAKASGQFNQKMLELVGMGGFLHDIGCTQLPKNIVCSPIELEADRLEQMQDHPKAGMNMVDQSKNIPDEVRYIIYQHHEQPSGRGYPNGLFGPVIYYPAKIVALADSFSALISKRSFRPAYSVEEAIKIIQSEHGKYDRDLVKIMASVFLKSMGGGKTTKKKAA